MLNDLSFRTGTLKDFIRIESMVYDLHEIHRKNLPDIFKWKLLFYSPKEYINGVTQNGFILLYDNQKNVGYAEIIFSDNQSPYLNALYIKPSLRNKKYGSALLSYCIEHVKSLGYKHLVLSVWNFNEAKSLYDRFGFVETKRKGPRIDMKINTTNFKPKV